MRLLLLLAYTDRNDKKKLQKKTHCWQLHLLFNIVMFFPPIESIQVLQTNVDK